MLEALGSPHVWSRLSIILPMGLLNVLGSLQNVESAEAEGVEIRSYDIIYKLTEDIGETTDVAAQNPDVLAKLRAFAAQAHRSMPQGEVYDRALVEKDRNYLGKPARPKAKNPGSAKKKRSNAP